MTPAEIAAACLADEIKPLEAADQLLRAYEFLPGQPIWEATGGPHGPLTALYQATEEIDRIGYIGNDPDWWHVSVREAKRVELVETQVRMEQPVKAACRAIIAAMPPMPPFFALETTTLQGENGMTDERIGALHLELNAPRFNRLKHFRRNHALYQITAPVNCLVGCVLSHNVEMIPVLVQRCRSEIAAVGTTVAAIEEAMLRAEYLDLVQSYLKKVEASFGSP